MCQLLAELPEHLSLLVGMEELPVKPRAGAGPGCGRGVLQAAWGEGRAGASGLEPVSDWSGEEEETGRVGLARQASSSGEGRRGCRGCLEARGSPASSSSWGIKKQEERMITTRRRDGTSGLGHSPRRQEVQFPRPAAPLPSLASACSPSTRGKVSAPLGPRGVWAKHPRRQVSMNPRSPGSLPITGTATPRGSGGPRTACQPIGSLPLSAAQFLKAKITTALPTSQASAHHTWGC